MAGQINTSKVLNNGYNTGGGQTALTGPIAINPAVSSQYDYATTDDPILLNERKDTAEVLYDIFKKSPYFEKYKGTIKKIDKSEIFDIFYYFFTEMSKKKKISDFEFLIAINEFFDFNYIYIWQNVVSTQMKSEILDDLYNNYGKKRQIDNQEKLF